MIYDITRKMLNATAQNVMTFAMHVAERYLEQVHPDFRQVKFREDLVASAKSNAQILDRYMKGTVKVLPADLEDAWVDALPEPYRSDCERELAARRGRYSEKRIEATAHGEAIGLADLATQFGELVTALGPALSDGRITESDLPHARRIVAEADDLISAVLATRRNVAGLLQEMPHG
ncbi:hypothetical protein [Arenimonas oryziterrae]|uniref:Uncharacterized protein n=1 Tax=Arenimonas oryziterrae DSM 21050 = YC6267 TaxID=1121015 RepID=A0A091AQ78_9GAMM|nr:hypothetical protein [Arenimonas oryziterrae]KFN42323.1 hypothetical protein N789_14120 [Arenimonas oryziterrae DSM 21050 = YC6267]